MSTAEASLSGIVTDKSTGDPLSGISVAIFNDSTNKKSTATTDSSGAYSIQSIAVGKYTVEVEGDDYNATNLNDLSLPAGNTVQNFTMSKGGSGGSAKVLVTGTVYQAESSATVDGQPTVLQPAGNISGATVTATNLNTGVLLASTTSDSNGNFSLEFTSVSFELTAKKNEVVYAIQNLREEGVGEED